MKPAFTYFESANDNFPDSSPLVWMASEMNDFAIELGDLGLPSLSRQLHHIAENILDVVSAYSLYTGRIE